ncbi:amidase [Nocardioides humi]|uniref:Asp-tRNA(Asn)/Glu-tRNA(Gln) amidotransferase subunit GatA n=1 Tax=Nocardioides humi TaxID=449461 RepID=A0ABN1ZTT6_9ACTN|nr:amidase [Nocardioides humi]
MTVTEPTTPTTEHLTIADAARALRDGTVTSVQLAEQAIAAADRLDDRVGTYISRYDETLLASAAAADADLAAGTDLGPLHGIPLGIKDIITTREGETTAQSLVLDRSWGQGDAVVVRRLREAGGLITGKLTTMEYAMGAPDPEKPFPIPRNPWNLDHWPGGSSSGTGSGVAAGMFLGGLGTDTGGSIRIPAMFCGISGLMPTFGRVPKSGCVPLGYSLDHIGPMARSAHDCAVLLQALAGYDASDLCAIDEPVPDYAAALTGDLTGLTIGVDRTSGADLAPYVDPALAPALDAAIAQLEAWGASVVDVTLPHYELTMASLWPINAGESGAYHRPDAQTRLADYARTIRLGLGSGTFFSGADYVQAQRVRRVATLAVAELFGQVDLVLTPSAWQGALSIADLTEGDSASWIRTVNTPYWDVTGHPVITVPIGFTGAGLPLGMQLAGRPFDEATVLRAADAFQRDTDWHLAVPAIAA